MRQTLFHSVKIASIFALGLGLSSAFNYLIVSNNYSLSAVPVAENPSVPVKIDSAVEKLPVAPVDSANREVNIIAKKGDTLLGFLKRGGINAAEAFEISNALQGKVSASAIQTGQPMKVALERSSKNPKEFVFKELKIPYAEKLVQVSRTDDGKLEVNALVKPLKKETVRAGAEIYGSLMGSAESIGIPGGVMQSIISAYSYDVDFQRDIQAGDRFEVVYESMQDEGGHAQLMLSGTPHRIYFYTDKSGQAGFYTEDGKSVKRALLRTPVNGARMTSGYGMRMHPILGYSKMHRGVDFAAPIGTPVYAAGDGRIVEEGRKSSYGNYVRIRHSGEFSTAYAHLNRFAPGVHNGSRVKQGQVIAYVGMTGRATGPHLHFELIKGSTQINPSSVKTMSAGALSKHEMVRFKHQQEKLRQTMASLPMQTQLASLK